MQKSKRIKLIKDIIIERKDVQISEITSLIDASESTIRRDIKELAKEGFITELYGSIVLNEVYDKDILLSERETTHLEEKNEIAKKAAALIKNHNFVYIDAGSTTFQMIKYITAKNITIVTNGINIVNELSNYNFNVQLVGGSLKTITMAIVGELAAENVSRLYFDISFIGSNGISEFGYSTPDIREGILKRKVILNSKKPYVLADKSKQNKTTSFVFASTDECGLITN